MSETPVHAEGVQLAGGARLNVLPEFGGRLNELVLVGADGKPRSVIAGLYTRAALQADTQFRNIALFPFANRLADGRFATAGKTYQFPINEPARNNALHGFLYRTPPSVTTTPESDGAARLRLEYNEAPREYYPFPAKVILDYTLTATALELRAEIHNTGAGDMPFSFGLHPYYCLGAGADALELQLPAGDEVDVDGRGLPTGKRIRHTAFTERKTIADASLDTHYALTGTGERAEVTLWNPAAGFGLEVWQDRSAYPNLQVFIPPGRDAVAVEPMTASIDALNSGEGLITLPPGGEFSGRCGVQLIF